MRPKFQDCSLTAYENAFLPKAFVPRLTTLSARGPGARYCFCHGRGDNRKITELIVSLAGDVKGSADLGELMHAAEEVPSQRVSGTRTVLSTRS